jgi:hypothetical protein
MSQPGILVAPAMTDLPSGAAGAVLVTGAPGGLYAGMLAARAGVRAVIFHDAGIGAGGAGIAALAMLAKSGVPAAVVSHMSARIGDAEDMVARGVLSRINPPGLELGLTRAMPCAQAAQLLLAAPRRQAVAPDVAEVRTVLRPDGATRDLVLVDSAALVEPSDAGAVVVTGSHCGTAALGVDAFAAAFNDAGIGIDQAGIACLTALDARGIAAIAVAAGSARIGDAHSTFEAGVITAANETAIARGATIGTCAKDMLLAWTRKDTTT